MKRFFTLFAPEGDTPPGGGAGPAWHESIITKGADGAESLADFNTWKDKAPAPLVKMITDNMTAARSKTEGMVKVPGEGATPEELSAFYKALGVPEQPDEYGIKAPEKMPDGVSWDDNMGKAFAAKAKELGLTKAQAAGLAQFHVEQTGASVAEMRANAAKVLEAEKADLTKRFGTDIDKAVAAAKSLENAKGVPESLRAAAKGGAFDPTSPNFWGADALEAFAWAAKATGEDRGGGGPGVGAGAVDLAAAKDIMNNKENPLHAKYWAGDKDVVERVNAAYKTAA